MRTIKALFIPIVFLVSIFSLYSENSHGRMCCADGPYLPKDTITIIKGTGNIVNLLNHLQVIDNDKITIPYRPIFTSISGITYQIENAEECLRKIKHLVAPNTSYSSLEIKGPEDDGDDQNLRFILEWRFWDKTESVTCPVKSIKSVVGKSMNS
ncbi:MAG: hypothetical protein IPL83_12400 [Bdellovibrionales bacterium]|nr:hypothetical protein [Bdellovibrionales bacterium]